MKAKKRARHVHIEARGARLIEDEEAETGETTIHPAAETSFWPRTIWLEVQEAAREVGKSPEQLNRLILRYQRPLRGYLLHQFRYFPEITSNADDLLQGFASQKLFSESWLAKASPQRGRFRDYLKTSLKNYVVDWAKRARPRCISLDELASAGLELAGEEREEESFDFPFAQEVIAETLERLEQDCKDPNRDQPRSSQIWEVFRLRLLDPISKGTKPEPYERLWQRFSLRSPTEGTNMLLTAKRMFKRHLEAVIADYEGGDGPARTELARLTEFVSGLAKKRPDADAQDSIRAVV